MKDYYDILQVSRNAEQEVIEAAYRRLARKYHPDVHSGPDAALRMRELNEAYEVLGDPGKRAEYDAALGRAWARAHAGRAERDRPPPQPGSSPTTQSTGPDGSARQGSAKTVETPAGRPARPRPALIALGLAGLMVAGAWIAVGVWFAMGSAGDGGKGFSAFAKDWWHHGLGLSVQANGQASATWRSYKWCSDDPSPSCDTIVENRIIAGGSATLMFERMDGSTAFGRVVSSNDERVFAPGSEVLLMLLPYDMATLEHLGYETTLCGPDYPDLAPKSLFDTFPCGA